MGKMTLGSGGPSKEVIQQEQLVSVEKYDDSQLKAEIESLKATVQELYSRAPQIVETRTVETVIEKQPIQNIYPVQEAEKLDLSHLLTVDRHEAEFKMLNQAVGTLGKKTAEGFMEMGQKFDAVINKEKVASSVLVNELRQDVQKAIDLVYADLQNTQVLIKNNTEMLYGQLSGNSTSISILNDNLNTIDVNIIDQNNNLLNKIDKLEEKKLNINKKLKMQKILNVVLFAGLLISLFK